MLKIGVIGAGHLGSIHIKLLKEIQDFHLVGFFDLNDSKKEHIKNTYDIKAFESIDELLDAVDAVDIVTPTMSHFDIATKALKKSKHVFIEKPVTNTVSEAKQLLELEQEAGVKVQVGHVERFNPAFLTARERGLNPLFIESHRLAEFQPRGTDVSVVYDLMIHDIDIILSLVKSDVKMVQASGVSILSDNPDIASARIEFKNGTVANLTASRFSMKKERKMRIFQESAYITIDFDAKQLKVFTLKDKSESNDDVFTLDVNTGKGGPDKVISFTTPNVPEGNAIKMELETFYNAIVNDLEPEVSLYDGYQAVRVAHMVLEQIEDSLKRL